jgi:hypothetical protein
VLQLNAFDQRLRGAVRSTLSDIADQCDGVRCDMAMLMTNDVFEKTWGHRAGPKPATEYWRDVIPATKAVHPDFLFMAEAYWGLEWELQQQGFDFCYDKTLYDRLEHDSAEHVRLHLCADLVYQDKLVRFIENHDEPRAATAFPSEKERAAAVASSTLPGAVLFHEGQFDGRRVRLPVFLSRRPDESADPALHEFYMKLLGVATSRTLRDGQWRLCNREGWPDNASYERIVSWCWENGDERYLVAINLSAEPAQARIRIEWKDLGGHQWRLNDTLSGHTYERAGDDLAGSGLYVDLGPWSSHLFACERRNVS